MKVYIVIVDENRGFECKKENIEKCLEELKFEVPESYVEVKEIV